MDDKAFKSRIDPRLKTVVSVSFKSDDPDEHLKEGVITNFSRSGIFIETVFIYPVDTHVFVDVFLPEETTPLHLIGEVRNVVLDESVVGGMGIKINQDKISDTDKDRIKEFFDLNHIYGWFC